MTVLNKSQITKEYLEKIGGFPSSKIVHEINEYNGEEQVCVACTQLSGEKAKVFFPEVKSYSERDKKRILKEWIDFKNKYEALKNAPNSSFAKENRHI